MKKKLLTFIIINFIFIFMFGKVNKVFVIPFSHLDIGFTGTQQEVSQLYIEMMNNLLEIMEIFPDFTFTIETYWQLQQWLESSPSQQNIQKLIEYLKSGRLELGVAYASLHTGFMNELSLNSALRYSLEFAKENNFIINTAIMNDVPGYSQDLPDIFYKNNISYFMSGINDKYADILKLPGLTNIFYWEGPNGGRVLTWITKGSYMEGITYKNVSSLEHYIKELEENGYPYDAVALLVAFDNAGIEPGVISYLNFIETSSVSELEIKFSTPSVFFKYMEENYKENIPTYSGDWSGFWESVKTGGPYSSSLIRWSQEILNEMVSLELTDSKDQLFKAAIENILLYCEHTSAPGAGWPGNYTLEQTDIFNKTVVNYAITAYNSILELINNLHIQKLDNNSLNVFNPGNSERESLLKFELDEWDPNFKVLIKFNKKEYIAYPFISNFSNPWEQINKGYEVYLKLPKGISEIIIKGIQNNQMKVRKENNLIMENDFYRIIIKTNGTFDIFDKKLKLWIAKSVGGFEYAYTNSMEIRNEEIFNVESYEFDENPQQRIIRVKTVNSPIVGLEIILPNNEKRIIFSYFIDQTKIPYVPYEKHSINYFLKIPINYEGKFIYRGPGSIIKDPYGFPALRPEQVAVRDLFALKTDKFIVTMATRQAFMVGYDKESKIVDCLLLRHYDEAATKDLGIVNLERVEPDSPDILTFSFLFTTGNEIDVRSVENFMKPPIVIKWFN